MADVSIEVGLNDGKSTFLVNSARRVVSLKAWEWAPAVKE